MYVKETKKRSLFKSISWRMVAFLNSWIILSLNVVEANIMAALLMNISGLIIYYGFERAWNLIKYGRTIIKEKSDD